MQTPFEPLICGLWLSGEVIGNRSNNNKIDITYFTRRYGPLTLGKILVGPPFWCMHPQKGVCMIYHAFRFCAVFLYR